MDVKLTGFTSRYWKRLEMFLRACPLIKDFDIRIAYNKHGQNDEAFFYGFENKFEQDNQLADDYKCWRIRFNIGRTTVARLLKTLKDIVEIIDNNSHKNNFVFEVWNKKNESYAPIDLLYIRKIFDYKFRSELNRFD
jgi:hypothetical protein